MHPLVTELFSRPRELLVQSLVPSGAEHFTTVTMPGLVRTAQHYLAAFAAFSAVSSAAPGVTLPGYGSFVGTTVGQTLTKKPLPAAVDAWLGIDYASQPVGEGRFAPVGAPAAFDGWKNASAYGYVCVQDPEEISYAQDEACLSMNVFRTQGVSFDEKLPILIWIHGVSQNLPMIFFFFFALQTDQIRAVSSQARPGALTVRLLLPILRFR